MNSIIKGFRTIVFIFIVISTTFWPICPPAFFRCLSNSGTFTELRTTSFIESTGVTWFWFNKDVVQSYVKVLEFNKHLKKAGGHIGQNVVEITIKMKTIVRKPLKIKITKLCLRNLDNLNKWIYNDKFSTYQSAMCRSMFAEITNYYDISYMNSSEKYDVVTEKNSFLIWPLFSFIYFSFNNFL